MLSTDTLCVAGSSASPPILPSEPTDRRTKMTRIDAAQHRVQQASDLAAVLDAAYEAFEAMLSVIHLAQDPASGRSLRW